MSLSKSERALSGSPSSMYASALFRREWTSSGSRSMALPKSSTARPRFSHLAVGVPSQVVRCGLIRDELDEPVAVLEGVLVLPQRHAGHSPAEESAQVVGLGSQGWR